VDTGTATTRPTNCGSIPRMGRRSLSFPKRPDRLGITHFVFSLVLRALRRSGHEVDDWTTSNVRFRMSGMKPPPHKYVWRAQGHLYLCWSVCTSEISREIVGSYGSYTTGPGFDSRPINWGSWQALDVRYGKLLTQKLHTAVQQYTGTTTTLWHQNFFKF
jgi:hypothetical protein